MAEINVTYDPDWRASFWEPDIPSRPAWFVTCSEHPHVGKSSNGEPWGYADDGTAQAVATRHRRRHHIPDDAPGGGEN